MPRGLVGLLSALSVFMAALAALTHGVADWLIILTATLAAGAASYGALPNKKKSLTPYVHWLVAGFESWHRPTGRDSAPSNLIGANEFAGQDHCSRVCRAQHGRA